MWKGIDVSDNQGVIDWSKVAASGVQFAILRSVRRSGKADYQFAANLAGCRQYNIPVAVYKYTYATTEAQAQEEARQVVALLQQHGMASGTMVWWDVEDRDTLQPLGREKLTALIQVARNVIEAAGYRFGIYVGLYVYQEGWFDFNQFAAAPLWVARYYNGYNVMQFSADPDQDKKPNVGRALWGWQYTSTGRVPGINGNTIWISAIRIRSAWKRPGQSREPSGACLSLMSGRRRSPKLQPRHIRAVWCIGLPSWT